VLHSVLRILWGSVLNIRGSFAEPGLALVISKLDIFDLSECGKNFFYMLLENVPCKPANVNLGWLRGP